jgi:hypothetical protein
MGKTMQAYLERPFGKGLQFAKVGDKAEGENLGSGDGDKTTGSEHIHKQDVP